MCTARHVHGFPTLSSHVGRSFSSACNGRVFSSRFVELKGFSWAESSSAAIQRPLGAADRYLQLRFEAFNLFNHPNFNNVNLNWTVDPPAGTSPTALTINTRPTGDSALYGSYFGEYSSTYTGSGGPRVPQLAVKFYF